MSNSSAARTLSARLAARLRTKPGQRHRHSSSPICPVLRFQQSCNIHSTASPSISFSHPFLSTNPASDPCWGNSLAVAPASRISQDRWRHARPRRTNMSGAAKQLIDRLHTGQKVEPRNIDMTLHQLAKKRDVSTVHKLMEAARRRAVPLSVHAYTAAINSCRGSNAVEQASRYYKAAQDDAVAIDLIMVNAYLAILAEAGRSRDAMDLHRRLPEMGLSADSYTYASLLHSLRFEHDPHSVVGLVDKAVESLGSSTRPHVFSAALNSLAKMHAHKQAEDVLARMQTLSIQADITHYNVVMQLCQDRGALGDCLSLLQRMNKEKVRPDEITFGIMMQAAANKPDCKLCLSLLGQMRQARLRPQAAHYCHNIRALSKAGKVDIAMRLVPKLQAVSPTPTPETDMALLELYSHTPNVPECRALCSRILSNDAVSLDSKAHAASLLTLAVGRAEGVPAAQAVVQSFESSYETGPHPLLRAALLRVCSFLSSPAAAWKCFDEVEAHNVKLPATAYLYLFQLNDTATNLRRSRLENRIWNMLNSASSSSANTTSLTSGVFYHMAMSYIVAGDWARARQVLSRFDNSGLDSGKMERIRAHLAQHCP